MADPQPTFHINYWNGKFHYCIWYVKFNKSRNSRQLNTPVDHWPIEMTPEQLATMDLETLKRLYAARIKEAEEKFLASR